jgi:hypothetical protein
MREELTKAIKMEELAETYKELKTKAALGPSGIRNTQWKNAPMEMQLIILDLFNNIYDTGKVPRELKEGTRYPVPKDTTKPLHLR